MMGDDARVDSQRWRAVLVVLVLSVLFLCAPAVAQPATAQRDEYTLRSSTVPSTSISPAAAKAHGIRQSATTALLNVLVQRLGRHRANVAADVSARAINLAGMQREIQMREVIAPNGMVSYLGTFNFASNEVVDLEVRATPRGSSTQLQLRYRERMPRVPG